MSTFRSANITYLFRFCESYNDIFYSLCNISAALIAYSLTTKAHRQKLRPPNFVNDEDVLPQTSCKTDANIV